MKNQSCLMCSVFMLYLRPPSPLTCAGAPVAGQISVYLAKYEQLHASPHPPQRHRMPILIAEQKAWPHRESNSDLVREGFVTILGAGDERDTLRCMDSYQRRSTCALNIVLVPHMLWCNGRLARLLRARSPCCRNLRFEPRDLKPTTLCH